MNIFFFPFESKSDPDLNYFFSWAGSGLEEKNFVSSSQQKYLSWPSQVPLLSYFSLPPCDGLPGASAGWTLPCTPYLHQRSNESWQKQREKRENQTDREKEKWVESEQRKERKMNWKINEEVSISMYKLFKVQCTMC